MNVIFPGAFIIAIKNCKMQCITVALSDEVL